MILWLTTWYPDVDAPGRATFVKKQFDALQSTGTEAQLLFLDFQSSTKLFALTWESMSATEHRLRIESTFWRVLYHLPGAMAPFVRKAWMQHQGIKPSLIHGQVIFPAGVMVRHLARSWKVPYGITEHWSKSSQFLKRFWLGRQAQHAYRNAQFILPVSEHLAHALKNDMPSLEQVAVVPNVITVKGRKDSVMSERSETVNILGVASLIESNRHIKKIEVLIEALKILGDRHPNVDWCYRHIGGGAREKALKEFSQSVGVNASWEGSQRPEFVQQAYLESDLLVHLTTTETFGMVVYEAALSGLPVICSDINAFRHIIDRQRRVSIEAHAVADAIEAFWNSPSLSSGIEGSEFSVQAVGERMARAYQ